MVRFHTYPVGEIHRIRQMIGDRPIDLEVDGGVNVDTIKHVVDAGADVLVAGSAVFKDNYAAAIGALRVPLGDPEILLYFL